jgi:predicted ester cyclase
MSSIDNQSVLRRYLELMTRGPIEELPSIVAEDVTGYDGNERVVGLAAIVSHARDAQAGCPDLKVDVEHVIEQGEWVAFFGVTSGHQTGALFGMTPSNREFRVQGMAMARVRDGKIAEIRTGWDTLSFAHQLGTMAEAPMANRIRNAG